MSQSSERRRRAAQPATRPPLKAATLHHQRVWMIPAVAILALASFTAWPSIRQQPGVVQACWGAVALLTAWLVGLVVWTSRRGRRLSFAVALRPQHYVQACAHTSIYLYWGYYWGEVYNAAPLIAAQLAFAYAFDALLTWSRTDVYTLGFGPFPIIFSTNLFLWFRPDWFHLQFLMVAVGFAAKSLIRWTKNGQRVHVFNPSSFALSVFSIALLATGQSDITWGPQIAVTQLMPPHMYLLIFLVALPGQFLFGVAAMTLAAVATTFAFTLAYYAATGIHYFVEPSIPIAVFLGMHLLFTDPSTAPRSELGRVLFGVLYALSVIALFSLLQRAGMPAFYDKLLAVPVLNLLIQGIDRLAGARRLAWLDPGQWGRGLSLRARHVGYIAVWAVVFTVMQSATQDHVALARADVFLALNRAPEAVEQFQALLARNPDMPLAHSKLGLALLRAGRGADAIAVLQEAARRQPAEADIQTNLGLALMQTSRLDEATNALSQAVTLDPSNAESRYNFAQLLAERGRGAEAATELRAALRYRPEWPTAMGALAWLQATQPAAGSTPQDAVALASRAADLSGHRDVAILDALGAAYASAQQFPEATQTAEQALALAAATAPHLAPGIRARVELYKARKDLVNAGAPQHTAQQP